MTQPTLLPQDVVVLAKLLGYEGSQPSMAVMGGELFLSASQVHAALNRLTQARLVVKDARGHRPLRQAVEEFLIHGVKYAFPPRRGEITRGMPTSWAAPPLDDTIVPNGEPPPVWPSPNGPRRGVGLQPLYKKVPAAAARDRALYQLLALVDAVRDGRARERALAEKEITERVRGVAHR